MYVERLAAFTLPGGEGGNKAGVVLCEGMPSSDEMVRVAAEIGYPDTAFLVGSDQAWDVRYATPKMEIPLCGHATIALGAWLGQRTGRTSFALRLRDAEITVEASQGPQGEHRAAFISPPTEWRPLEPGDRAVLLHALGVPEGDVDGAMDVAWIHGGSDHLLVGVSSRERLAEVEGTGDSLGEVAESLGIATVMVVFQASADVFDVRNFAPHAGIPEDPATGSAAAAFGGFARDRGVVDSGAFLIRQGEDMGQPCRIAVSVGPELGRSVRVSGSTAPVVN